MEALGVAENLNDREWLEKFRLNAARRVVPVGALMELTSRCNLRCQHCYLGPQDEQQKKRNQELTSGQVKANIDELVKAGCLTLTITGGDPMMRRDFAEVYRYAREQGLLVSVFCDGILVTEKIITLFREFPPRRVEVSIYGATEETYETVTRVPGSFEHAKRGIQRLLDAGIHLELKTVLMALNKHELEMMQDWAAELGVSFRFDAAIFPCLPDNAVEPLDLRVSPEEVVEKEMASPLMRERWLKKFQLGVDAPADDRLYSCGAGRSALYINPFGELSPCVMTTHVRHKLGEKPLQQLWDEEFQAFRDKKATRSGSALHGPLKGMCSHCPAFNLLENGDEETDSDYGLKLVELRLKYPKDDLENGTHNE